MQLVIVVWLTSEKKTMDLLQISELTPSNSSIFSSV